MEQSGGGWGQRWPGVGGEGEGRLYDDITPLLCHYVSEWCSFSMMSGGTVSIRGEGLLPNTNIHHRGD